MTTIMGTAWKGGSSGSSTGAGYGIKLSMSDRYRYFRREWGSVRLVIGGLEAPIVANIDKDSFWTATCGELISADLGRWMLAKGLAPWPRGKPPRFYLHKMAAGEFRLEPAAL